MEVNPLAFFPGYAIKSAQRGQHAQPFQHTRPADFIQEFIDRFAQEGVV